MDLTPTTAPARSAHGINAVDYLYPHQSWAAVMQHFSDSQPDAPWLVYLPGKGPETVSYTYGEFVEQSRRLSTLLVEKGVQRGDRVAVAGHNHPDTILTYFACWFVGACAVPLNMSEDEGRLTYIIENSKSKLVLCRTEYLALVETLVDAMVSDPEIVEVDTDAITSAFQQQLDIAGPAPYPDNSIDMRWDECLIVYTSGTTGNPKGVILIQQNLFADGYDIAAWHGIDAQSRMMCVLPVHHVNGAIVTHVAPFLAGASVVLHRKFSPKTFFAAIRDHHVNVASVVPTLLAFLLEAKADATGVVARGFRHIICGAGPLTCDLAHRFETAYSIPIVHGYGLSETTCYTCFLPTTLTTTEHQHWLQSFGFPSIGVALPCNEMSIHSEAGKPVAEGERGEIVARGPNVMKEYYANPSANEKAFEFGWFRSGDEGFYQVDEHGTPFYFITGRLKELIIRGGVNLAPLEIDEVINKAPGVRAGISVGFENSMYGEEVGALVIKSVDSASEESILAYCQEHLPYNKAPKVVLFTEELPVTSTGKFQRIKVRHLFAEWKTTQFRKP